MRLDHLAVTGQTRDLARTHIEEALGVPLQEGGAHPHFGTHNALLGLETELYLEAIAVDPAAPPLAHARWFALDEVSGPPRLSHWICAVDDLPAVVAALPEAGDIVALERGDLRWRMAVPRSGRLPWDCVFPALIQWDGPHPAPRLMQQGVRLDALEVRHPEARGLQQALEPWLKAPLVHFTPGEPGLRAAFRTPDGSRVLT